MKSVFCMAKHLMYKPRTNYGLENLEQRLFPQEIISKVGRKLWDVKQNGQGNYASESAPQ